MVDAAGTAGVTLLVGHSHSHDLPIRRMRDLIESGALGPVGMVNTGCYSDWIERPHFRLESATQHCRQAFGVDRWGLATLELCIAALESSRTGTEARLSEQVAVHRA